MIMIIITIIVNYYSSKAIKSILCYILLITDITVGMKGIWQFI